MSAQVWTRQTANGKYKADHESNVCFTKCIVTLRILTQWSFDSEPTRVNYNGK